MELLGGARRRTEDSDDGFPETAERLGGLSFDERIKESSIIDRYRDLYDSFLRGTGKNTENFSQPDSTI